MCLCVCVCFGCALTSPAAMAVPAVSFVAKLLSLGTSNVLDNNQ